MSSAAQKAKEIAARLWNDASIRADQNCNPVASEIPVDAQGSSYGLIVNFGVDKSRLSMPVIWRLTVPVIRQLYADKQLYPFKWIGVQIVAMDGLQNLGRVLRVESLVDDIAGLRLCSAEQLLDQAFWDVRRFTCYWYWNKDDIPRT